LTGVHKQLPVENQLIGLQGLEYFPVAPSIKPRVFYPLATQKLTAMLSALLGMALLLWHNRPLLKEQQ
jgi:hypothetical protein